MPRSINDVIDDLGCGHAQFLLCTFGGGLYWVDGVIMTLFATLPSAIVKELDLDTFHRATLFSSSVLGLLLGNYMNIVNDSYFGRRKPIIFGYFCSIICVMASASFYTFWPIVWCWLVAGFGLGLGLPAWNTLCVEATPATQRMLIGGISQAFYSISAITVLATEMGYSWNFDFGSKWREIVVWTQLPGILLGMCAVLFGFVDSPHCLLAQGNVSEARAVLETIRRQNNCPNVSIDFDINSDAPAIRYSVMDVLRVMFGKRLVWTTLVMCLTTAVINFVGYGFGYSLPIMLPKLDLGIYPPVTIMGGCVAEVVGYCVAIFASNRMPRITQMIWFFSLSIFYCVIMSFGIARVDADATSIIGKGCILFVCFTLQAVTAPGWLVIYTYAAEVFPTMCRSFSGGFVIGSGRIGSMAAPYIFEAMVRATGSFAHFFVLLSLLMSLTMAAVILVFKETKGVPLSNHLGEEEPLVKSGHKPEAGTFAGSPVNTSIKPVGSPQSQFSDF